MIKPFKTLLIALAALQTVSNVAHAQLSCTGAEQVSVGMSSTAPDFASREPAAPPNGNFIVFSSKATNLSNAFIPGTSSNTPNIYRYSPGSALELLSVNTLGTAPERSDSSDLLFGCLAPSVTNELSDGSYAVAFHSDAFDLVSPPISGAGGITQIYLRLPKINRTHLISRDFSDILGSNITGNANSERASVAIVSSNSTSTKYRVCYQSLATNIVDGVNENGQVIYCRDINVAGQTITEDPTIVLQPAFSNESAKKLSNPSLSADGRTLTFESDATILTNKPPNIYLQIYTYSFDSQSFQLISANSSGLPATGESTAPTISGDSQTVMFHYSAVSLNSPADLKGLENFEGTALVKHSTQSGINSQVNVNATGTPSNGTVHSGRIDFRAQYAVFSDNGTNLTPGDSLGYHQVYLKALSTGEIVRGSVTGTNQSGNEESGFNNNPAFTAPIAIGHSNPSEASPFLALLSNAPNLASIGVPDSTKPFIFRSLFVTPTPTPTPTPTATPTPTNTPTASPTPRTITNQIRITAPPALNILAKSPQGLYDLEVICELFKLDPLKIKLYPELVELLASQKARLTYEIEIRKAGSTKRITRVSSRNTTTVRKLSPGRYTVRYRVVATKGSKKIQSRTSPAASISLS